MATQDLTFVLRAKNDAKRATNEFRKDMKAAGQSTKQISEDAKRASKNTDKIADEAKRVKDQFNRAGKEASEFNSIVKRGAGLVAGLFAGVAVGQLFGTAIQQAVAFDQALVETSTLIDGNVRETEKLRVAAQELADTYGTSGTQQVQAFYQAISAGAGDVSEATELLDVANQLAEGGVTEVATAVDILTTATNAYANSGLTAEEASDSLFIAMKAGKTTIDELAGSLGNVIPFAASAGVNFDEVTSAVAALTTQGIDTRRSVTGLRAIFAAILKPSEEAKEAAEDLGLAFNSTALEAKGLQGFFQDVIEAAGGNRDVLAQLFGQVEALAPVYALAGAGGDKLNQILEEQAKKAGATKTAFDLVNSSISDQFTDAVQSLSNSLTRIGAVLLTVVAPAIDAFAKSVKFLLDNIDILIIAIGVLSFRALAGLVTQLRVVTLTLGLLTGGFSLATIAAGAFGVAMNLLPFVAVTGALVLLYRTFTNGRSETEKYIDTLNTLKSSIESVGAAATAYYTDAGPKTAKAYQDAAKAALENAAANVAQAKAALSQAKVQTFLFGIFAGGAGRIREATEALREAEDFLRATSNQFQDATRAVQEVGDVSEEVTKSLTEQAEATREVSDITRQAVPAVEELAKTYGDQAVAVREVIMLQNELAEIAGATNFDNLIAETATLFRTLGFSGDSLAVIQERLIDIQNLDSFRAQADAALDLANEVIEINGGMDKLDEETRKVVEKLLEAARQAQDLEANSDGAASGIASAAREAADLANNLTDAAGAIARVQNQSQNLRTQAAADQARLAVLQAGGSESEADVAGRVVTERARLEAAVNQPGVDPSIKLGAENELKTLEADATAAAAAAAALDAQLAALRKTTKGSAADRNSQVGIAERLIQGYKDETEAIGVTGDALEELRIRQQITNAAARDGVAVNEALIESVLRQRQAYEDAKAAQDTFVAGAKQGWEDFKNSVQTNAEFARDFTKNAFQGLANTISDFVKTGKLDFKSLIADLLGQISAFLANRLVIDFLGASFGSTGFPGIGGGAGQSGGTLDFIKSIFTGFLAEGGPAQASKSYLVGEQGPELFIPRTSGTVIPADKTAALQDAPRTTNNVVFNISTPDVQGFNRSQGQIQARMAAALDRANARNN